MVTWERLSKDAASRTVEIWEKMDRDDYSRLNEQWSSAGPSDLSPFYTELRQSITSLEAESRKNVEGFSAKNRYPADLYFAVRLYSLLNEKGMRPCDASDDDIWRYLQIRAVPDLINARWKPTDGEKRINDERMWEHPRRIWLKILWWYVHLSLQDGSLEKTEDVLKNNGSDDISQLVERAGNGYRLELYRTIMKKYGETPHQGSLLLRRVLKLNIVRCATIEPQLNPGGIEAYVTELFQYCRDNNEPE